MGMVAFLFFPVVAGVMAAIVVCRAAGWCLDRRRRVLRLLIWLILAALAGGTVYGLLRMAGIVRLSGDNTYSVNLFDASWRDDGARLLLLCGGPFTGIAAALIRAGRGG